MCEDKIIAIVLHTRTRELEHMTSRDPGLAPLGAAGSLPALGEEGRQGCGTVGRARTTSDRISRPEVAPRCDVQTKKQRSKCKCSDGAFNNMFWS